MSTLLTDSTPEKRPVFNHMEAVSRKPASPLRSEDGQSSHSGDAPTSPSKSQFPIYLQSSNILKSNCKMTVSNCLFYAVLKARFQKTRFFLDRGLDVNSRNDFGYNVLVAALHIDHDVKREKMFNMLLRHGADPQRRDLNHGRNTLSWACYLGREKEVIKILDDFGGNMDLGERDADGLTALHHATHAASVTIVRSFIETFLKYRLSVDVQDSQGMTAYVHARRSGMKEIADVLRYEGFASPCIADSMYFKSPREWSQIGRFERHRGEQYRKREERNRAKIEGRLVRPRVESDIPEDETVQEKLFERRQTKEPEERNDRPRDTNSLPLNRPTAEEDSEHAQTQTRSMSERGYDQTDGTKRPSGGVALSLIGLSGEEHGHLAKTFHHSELDTTKVSEYSQMVGGIHALMTILSHEQTPSFRKPVVFQAPPMQRGSPKPKSKVSTLAIILGKDKTKGKKSGRKGKGIDKNDNRKRKQASKRGMLPDIRLNDRM